MSQKRLQICETTSSNPSGTSFWGGANNNHARIISRFLFLVVFFTAALNLASVRAEILKPILIGLDAAMSGPSGQSGEAIRRGALIAIDEINQAGGVLGRNLALLVKDNRGVSARGIDSMTEFGNTQDVVAVVGGIHSPVALAQLKTIHQSKMIYLGAWAAATPIVSNGYKPNYVFRVSARDQYAGAFLINQAIRYGYKRPGLLLWRSGWGRSNEKAMLTAIKNKGIASAGTRWFNSSQSDMSEEISQLKQAGADVIMLVASASEGLAIIQNMANLPEKQRLPILGHWGMSGGKIFNKAPEAFSKVEFSFLQTYSFFKPPYPAKARNFTRSYCAKFKACGSPAKIVSPVGSAHAYDLVHLLKRAIEKAGSVKRANVRDALELLGRYDGLVKSFNPPFTKSRHDALDGSDFHLARYSENGAIVPTEAPQN